MCGVTEPRPFLAQLRDKIYRTFVAKEFVSFVRLNRVDEDEKMALSIMETRHRLRTDLFIKDASKITGGTYTAPSFDASDLHAKYEDFSWTEEFPLEKLCISEMGPKDFLRDGKVVRPGYRDIACVPLPGVVAASTGCEPSDEDYLPAACAKVEN